MAARKLYNVIYYKRGRGGAKRERRGEREEKKKRGRESNIRQSSWLARGGFIV
jgi:hypothetical protein